MKPALAYCRLRFCRSQYWFFYIISFSVHSVFSSVNRNFQIIALMLIFWLLWVKMNLISKWSNPSTEKEVTFIEFWSRWQTRLRPFHQALLWNAPKPATVCMEQKKLARVIWWCLARCYRKRSNPLHRKYRSLQRERPQKRHLIFYNCRWSTTNYFPNNFSCKCSLLPSLLWIWRRIPRNKAVFVHSWRFKSGSHGHQVWAIYCTRANYYRALFNFSKYGKVFWNRSTCKAVFSKQQESRSCLCVFHKQHL